MDEKLLITESRNLLNAAESALAQERPQDYTFKMSILLELLKKELAPPAPPEPEKPTPDGVA